MVEIAKYAEQIRRRIKPLFTEKQPEIITHRCCLRIAEQQISIVHVNKLKDKTELLLAKSFPYQSHVHVLADLLINIISKYHLAGVPVYWLLTLDDYQLFLIESLPVAKSEIVAALSFRLRSMISYPVEEAAIEYFMLPAKKSNPDHPMIVAIAAKKADLFAKVDIIKTSGMQLSTIDIPELALRNLSSIYETDDKSTAILAFLKNTVIINISHQKKLYFTRRIQFRKEDDKAYEQLCLEVVRYFDYFRNQWRFASPSRIFVIEENSSGEEMAKTLSEHLLVAVEPYKLMGISASQDNLESAQKNLLTLGCALRESEKYATPGN